MKNIISIFFLLLLTISARGQTALTSPDGKYVFTFEQQGHRLGYRLSYEDKTVTQGELGVDIDNHLVESAMGIPTDTNSVWTADLQLIGVSHSSKDNLWQPLYGENASIRNAYHELTLHFTKGSNTQDNQSTSYNKRKEYLFDIVVRAYNEGVAIRYHFPEATNGLFMHVTNDRTTFSFDKATVAWHESWAQGPYNKVPLLTSEKAWKDETERPLLLKTPDNLYVAIGEAGLHDFVRGKLKLVADGLLQFSMYGSADVITPYDMPWRVIMAAKKAVDIINNKQIFLDLNAPCQLQDTSWIKPGKVFRVSKLNMKSCIEGVDFAADRGMQYIELDAGWYGPEMKLSSSALHVAANRDINMEQLCRYAAGKGIGVWLYVNQRALYNQLDSILPVYQRWGVKGIKFGFVQVGSQEWTTWLHRGVEKCARYQLMVDIHDEYRPTGWSRTWPNLMTQEGVRGNEEMPDAEHNVTLPFTRFVCGPADYTLCYFSKRVKNTHAHQLAMAVVYYSPITFLYWYDSPNQYRGDKELDFWKLCPTVWDESIALDGTPGEYIVQARRKGDDWFVGAMNGKEDRWVTIDTGKFLQKGKKYKVEIYTDDPSLKTSTNIRLQRRTIKGGKSLKLPLLSSGGAALRFHQ